MFQPYVWDPYTRDPYVKIDPNLAHLPTTSKYRPAKLPLTAFMNSPTSGASWPEGDLTPRAVSHSWFDQTCPEDERLHVNTTIVNEIIGINFTTSDGIAIVSKWSKYLRDLDARCVNILWETPRIIDFELVSNSFVPNIGAHVPSLRLLGQPRLVSLWDDFSKSPVVTKFQWSPLVLRAAERNVPILSPPRNQAERLSTRTNNFIPGLVTLHVRRMDYESRKFATNGVY